MPTFVKVKIKEFDDIVKISIPIPFRILEENILINGFVLELKDYKYRISDWMISN